MKPQIIEIALIIFMFFSYYLLKIIKNQKEVEEIRILGLMIIGFISKDNHDFECLVPVKEKNKKTWNSEKGTWSFICNRTIQEVMNSITSGLGSGNEYYTIDIGLSLTDILTVKKIKGKKVFHIKIMEVEDKKNLPRTRFKVSIEK